MKILNTKEFQHPDSLQDKIKELNIMIKRAELAFTTEKVISKQYEHRRNNLVEKFLE